MILHCRGSLKKMKLELALFRTSCMRDSYANSSRMNPTAKVALMRNHDWSRATKVQDADHRRGWLTVENGRRVLRSSDSLDAPGVLI